jgi:hypothetical protein
MLALDKNHVIVSVCDFIYFSVTSTISAISFCTPSKLGVGIFVSQQVVEFLRVNTLNSGCILWLQTGNLHYTHTHTHTHKHTHVHTHTIMYQGTLKRLATLHGSLVNIA